MALGLEGFNGFAYFDGDDHFDYHRCIDDLMARAATMTTDEVAYVQAWLESLALELEADALCNRFRETVSGEDWEG